MKNLNIRNQDPTPPLECGDSVPGVDRGGLRVVIVIVIVIVVVIMVIVIIIVAIKVILKRGMSGTSMCDGVKGTFLFMGRGGAITDMEDH